MAPRSRLHYLCCDLNYLVTVCTSDVCGGLGSVVSCDLCDFEQRGCCWRSVCALCVDVISTSGGVVVVVCVLCVSIRLLLVVLRVHGGGSSTATSTLEACFDGHPEWCVASGCNRSPSSLETADLQQLQYTVSATQHLQESDPDEASSLLAADHQQPQSLDSAYQHFSSEHPSLPRLVSTICLVTPSLPYEAFSALLWHRAPHRSQSRLDRHFFLCPSIYKGTM